MQIKHLQGVILVVIQLNVNLKLFEVKETNINTSDGTIIISKTTKVTGKGQIYFINKFKEVK